MRPIDVVLSAGLNDRDYSLKLKMAITDSVTVPFTTIYCKGLRLYLKQTPPQPGAKKIDSATGSVTGSVTGSSTADFSKSQNVY